MGEGQGGGGKNHLVPPPLRPLPPGEGTIFTGFKMLEENSQILCVRISSSLEKALEIVYHYHQVQKI